MYMNNYQRYDDTLQHTEKKGPNILDIPEKYICETLHSNILWTCVHKTMLSKVVNFDLTLHPSLSTVHPCWTSAQLPKQFLGSVQGITICSHQSIWLQHHNPLIIPSAIERNFQQQKYQPQK